MGNAQSGNIFGLTEIHESSPVYSYPDMSGRFPIEINPDYDFMQPVINEMRQVWFVRYPEKKIIMMRMDLHKMTNEIIAIYERTFNRMMLRGMAVHEAKEIAVKFAKRYEKLVLKEFREFYYPE